jgi:hypothetical protein
MASEKKVKKKKLCKWSKKRIEKDFDTYAECVAPVTHVCTKCGRGASSGSYLCKGKKISRADCA